MQIAVVPLRRPLSRVRAGALRHLRPGLAAVGGREHFPVEAIAGVDVRIDHPAARLQHHVGSPHAAGRRGREHSGDQPRDCPDATGARRIRHRVQQRPQRRQHGQRDQVRRVPERHSTEHWRGQFRNPGHRLQCNEPHSRDHRPPPRTEQHGSQRCDHHETGEIAQLAGQPTRPGALEDMVIQGQRNNSDEEPGASQPGRPSLESCAGTHIGTLRRRERRHRRIGKVQLNRYR